LIGSSILRNRIMEWVLIGLGGLSGLVALVCAVLVGVKMLQNNQTAMGIITIVGLFVCGIIGYVLALIFGWQNRQQWGLQKVMPTLTISLILALVLNGVGVAMLLPKMMEEIKNQENNGQQLEEFDAPDFDFQPPQFNDQPVQ
jgi:cytochrome bd-type quinol oxidase subunit 2